MGILKQENTKGRLCWSIVLYSFISINLVCPLQLLPSVIYVGLFKTKNIELPQNKESAQLSEKMF